MVSPPDTDGLEPVSPTGPLAAWRRAAAVELARAGAAPDEAAVDALAVRTPEGCTIRPLFLDRPRGGGSAAEAAPPGAFPFVRGARAPGSAWVVATRHDDADLDRVARAVAEDVSRGVDGVVLAVDRAGRLGLDPASELAREAVGDGGVALVTAADLEAVLDQVDLERTLVWIDAGANAAPYAVVALDVVRQRGIASSARLYGGLDIAGALARDGSLPRSVSALAAEATELVAAWRALGVGGRPLSVGAAIVHEAGGHAAHEIGFALAALAELLRAMETRGVAPADAAAAVAIEVAIGGDVFLEIAKVRALRLAWSKLLVAAGVRPEEVPPPFIAARTGARALSTVDPWTNAVRSTTSAFAAAAAGVDLLVVRPWDEPLGAPDRGARRLARNTQLVLREEARLADVADPGGGSGLVEETTDALARAGWEELRRIEAEGGLLSSLEGGGLAARIGEAAAARGRDVARRRAVLVGVNDFAVPTEATPARAPLCDRAAVDGAAARARAALRSPPTVPDDARLEVAASIAARGGTIAAASQVLAVFGPEAPPSCAPLGARREGARFERVRARLAALGRSVGEAPRACLVAVGPAAAARLRLAYAQRLLEVGGFTTTLAATATIDEASAAAAAAEADGAWVVCLAGADEAYAALAEPLARAVVARSSRPPVVLQAGKPPPERETPLREAGLSGWFFAGGDAAEVLEELAARVELRAAPGGSR